MFPGVNPNFILFIGPVTLVKLFDFFDPQVFSYIKWRLKNFQTGKETEKTQPILMRKENKTQSIGTHRKPIQTLKLTYRA